MPSYSISAPDGNTYTITGPEGASREEVIQEVLSQNPNAGTARTFGGYAKEAVKGLGRGAVGFLETAGIGAAALLPEEVEKPVAAKIKELGAKFSPQAAPGYEDAIPTRIAEGLGSMVAPIIIPGGLLGKGLALGASGAGEARQRAQQETATPEQISTATAQGILPGLTDLLPFKYLMGSMSKVALTGLVSRGVRAASTGSVEALQEASQNIMQNAIAQGYKPEQGLYEGTGEAASYGGAVGAIAQGLMDLVLPGRARRGQQPQREDAQGQPEVAPPVVPEPVVPEPVVQGLVAPEIQEPPQAQPVKAAEAAAPVVAVAPEVKPVVAVAPEVKPGVITDDVIKDLGIKGYGSTNVKNTLRGVDLNTAEGQKTFDDTFTSANKNLKYDAVAVQAYRASVPNLYKAPSNEPAAIKLSSAAKVKPDGSGTSDVQLVSPKKPGKPGATGTDVAGVGGTKQPAGELTGGEEVLSDALTKGYEPLKDQKEVEYYFTGKRGSIYAHHADGTTTAFREPSDMAGTGAKLQDRSVKTIYVQDPRVIAPVNAKTELRPSSKGKVARFFTEDYGPKKAGEMVPGTETSFTTTPSVGSSPVEAFKNGSVHFGSPITAVTPVEKTAAPIKGKINKAKLEKKVAEPDQKTEVVAEGTPDPERLKRAAEYPQMKDAPKAAKDYYAHYGSIDESLKNLGFDLAEKTKKGEMGYAKEGGAPAQQFSDWIEKTGTPEQKVTLKKSQDEYAKLKAQAEDAVFVQRGVKQRDLEEAVREQLEREQRLAAETEFKQREREQAGEPETKAEADKADKDATAVSKTVEKIIAVRGTRKSKGVDAKDTEAISKTEEAMLDAESTEETDEVDRDEAKRKAFPARFSKDGTAGLEVTANERTGNLEVSLDGKVIHTQSFANPKLLANFKGDALERMVKERSRAAQNSEEFQNKLEELREQTPLDSYEFRFKALTDAAAGYEYGNNYANRVMENSDGGSIFNIRPSLRNYQASPAAVAENKTLSQKQIAENIIEAGRFGARSSKGETTTATGNTKADVTKVLKGYFKEDSRFDALTTVVQSEKDLPDEIRQSKDYRAGTRGVAYKNKVFLVADNIQPGRELGVFLHEAGAHIGFDSVMKPGDRQFLADQVRKWAKGNNDLVETKAAKVALEKGGNSNDEIIAYMTEELVNRGVKPTSFRPASTWLRRVAEAFKKVMTKLGLRQDITPQELVDFANGAAHIAIKAPGKAVEGAPRFSTGNPTLDAAVGRRAEVLTKEGDKPLATRIANFFGGDKKQAAMKFRVQVDDNEASVKSKLLAAGDTEPLIHLAFASKATDTAVTSILHGALQLDPKTGAFHAVKGVSLSTVHEHIQSIAKKLDASNPKEAFDSASHIFDLGGNVLRERSLPKELQGRFKFSPADVQAGEEALRIYGKEIRAAMDAWTEYKNGMLDAGLKAGRFSKDDVAAWKEANDYVPWHRILDDAKYGYETKSSAREFFGNLQTRGKIKELVGGNVEDRPIGGLFNNMEQLSFWLGTTTIKNHTGIKVVDSLLKLDATKIGSPDAAGVDKARVVRVYRDGVPTYYELGNELDAYAFMGVEQDTSDWVKMMATGANWLRRGTTMMPGFVTSQLFQDSFRATAYSGAKSPFTVGAKVFSEYARELKGDALTQHLASYGIIGRPDNILGAEKGRIRNQLGESATGIGRAAKAAFSALDKLTNASDAAQRRSIYKQTLKETGNESLALYKAIEIINFQTRGANQKISTLRHIIPFMNAYIQGMSITLRSLAGHGITLEERSTAMKMFYATAVKIGALSLLYTMLVSDDEEYQNTPDHQKMTGFIIPGTRQMIKDMTGYDPGGNLKIPAPTDLVGFLFKTVPESTYNYVSRLGTKNEIDNTKFLRGLSSAAIQAISPPSAVPQAVKPVLEIWTNYDFFTGSPVVGRGLQHLEKDQQFTSSTTEFAKVLGKYLPMAPVQIDHFVRGVFGLAGGTTMFAASQIIDSFTPGERPSARLNEIPQIKTFLSGKATSGLKEDFYELRDKLTTVTTTVNRLKTRDPEYLKEYLNDNKKLYALHQSGIVAKVDKVLGELRAYREQIDSDKTMSAESKRKIFDDIEAQEVQYLSMLNPSALRRISGL